MSLINEALKKARATQPMGAASGVAPGPALKPLSARRGKRVSFLTLPFIIAVVLVVALAGALLWGWYRADRVELVARANTGASAASASAAPKTAVAPVAAPVQEISQKPAEVVQEVPRQMVAPAPTTATTSTAAPTAAPPAEVHTPMVTTQAEIQPGPVRKAIVRLNANVPKPPSHEYKLEGIFYSPKGPSAVIDGDLVSVGSEVEDGKVVAIDNESATVLTTAGETNVLVLIR
jgi:hypothetical protein